MERVSSLYDSSYLKETLIKSDNDLISVSLKMHDKGGKCPVADGRGKVYNERGKSRT